MSNQPYELSSSEQRLIDAIRQMQKKSTTTVPPMMTIRIVKPGYYPDLGWRSAWTP